MAKFNGVEITLDKIRETRQHFADISYACIAEVKSGDVKVNHQDVYFIRREAEAKAALDGEFDHTLTFLQRAYWLQTGVMIALLP